LVPPLVSAMGCPRAFLHMCLLTLEVSGAIRAAGLRPLDRVVRHNRLLQ
jgi:hypothetical protein